MSQREVIDQILAATEPLKSPRGDRLPFYNWHLREVGTDDDGEAERLLRELDARGMAVVPAWNPRDVDGSLAAALRIAKLQHKLGLSLGINANACTYAVFNGDEGTAHLDDQGKPFFDLSFGVSHKIGCPFRVEQRYPAMRAQLEPFLDAYQAAGLTIDFIFADWEIDGPSEWNGAWDAARRCQVCREHIPDLNDFAAFQRTQRTIRSAMTKVCYVDPVLQRFPHCLVGNYAVYPHGGLRYWYDYFEQVPTDPQIPVVKDQGAVYRHWFDEFPLTGYTFAMPTVYTWYPTFGWYDLTNPDYRWFYNMLLVGSNAGQNTPTTVPIISFVHWHTTSPPPEPDPAVKQMSQAAYQELLWHLLLRGHDAFFLWSPADEAVEETVLIHQVYAAALEFRRFLDEGQPISFDVPRQPGPVVSGLRVGDEVLVRRTDFDDTAGPVELVVDGRRLSVPRMGAKCEVLRLAR